MYDIIKDKRDGKELTGAQIDFFIDGYTRDEIPDYQASALVMAVFINGMSEREAVDLTLAIANSGDKMDLSGIEGFKVDKHSSGGVGDKTTLVAAPIAAACGVRVAKMSGRGLGHTGGTIDKLESIPGFRTSLTRDEFTAVVNKAGLAVAGQSGELAPADKKLYALRDVTATVDCTALIASSIMGKKLASADDGIVLDVKVGTGSFNKTAERAQELARLMVKIGCSAGKRTIAVLSDMNRPLGKTVGNALEVIEAVETLGGNGEERFTRLCVYLAAKMLFTASRGTLEECEQLAQNALNSGRALQKLREMVIAQGGDISYIDDTSLFDTGITYEVKSPESGYICSVDTEKYGVASLLLGAGRNTKDEKIDFCAGIEVIKNLGDSVRKGETVAVLHASDAHKFACAAETVLDALSFGSEKPEDNDIILGTVE